MKNDGLWCYVCGESAYTKYGRFLLLFELSDTG